MGSVPDGTVFSVQPEGTLASCCVAKVYVSVFGENDALDETMEGLKSSSGFIRGRLAKELNLRNTPELKFLPDASIAYGLKMSKMIDEVVARDERDHVPEDEEQ